MCGLHASSPVAPIAFPGTVSFAVWVLFTGPPWSGSVFAACAFGVVSKEPLSTPCHDAPPVSSSCSFMVPGPVSLLHFEMISLIVGAEGPASPSCLLSSGSSSIVY